jgi:cytochrome b subunit of formate dehydrogenase
LACHGNKDSGAPPIDTAAFAASRHKTSSCTGCHSDIAEYPHPSKIRKVDCGTCHKREALEYTGSVHGRARAHGDTNAATCLSCHGSHDIRQPNDPASRLAPTRIVKTCGRCHAVEAKKFTASIHGQASAKGVRAAPTCVDCHGEHDILGPATAGSRMSRAQRAQACVSCHQSERVIGRGVPADRVGSFLTSFHGMAGQSGDVKVADCDSCHGWHDVQPSSVTTSRTNPNNLAKTCGQCHPGAGRRWAGGVKIHQGLSGEGGGSAAALWVVLFYRIAIPLTVLGMVLHNLLDLSRKMRGSRGLRHRKEETPLSLSERRQHAFNAFSFILLAYSGLALHSPRAWWAWPFTIIGGETARRNAHRAAAALFLITAAAHLAYLATAPGRRRLAAMLPAVRDLIEPFTVFSYNIGASNKKPVLAQFSYIEKFEYWALVWGSFVMTVTGGFLLLHNMALSYLPLWVIEVSRVAHYLEAVLACLAILIWHGYWVILDPDIYPLNWAWLTGETYLPKPNEHHDKER